MTFIYENAVPRLSTAAWLVLLVTMAVFVAGCGAGDEGKQVDEPAKTETQAPEPAPEPAPETAPEPVSEPAPEPEPAKSAVTISVMPEDAVISIAGMEYAPGLELAPGVYHVDVTKDGFESYTASVEVSGDPVALDVKLVEMPSAVPEEVPAPVTEVAEKVEEVQEPAKLATQPAAKAASENAPEGPLLMEVSGVKATTTPVTFEHHAQHLAVKGSCVTCHHTWDGSSAVSSCSAAGCHDDTSKAGKKATNGYYYAFHKGTRSCVSCHKSVKATMPKAPTKCSACHVK